MRAITRESIIAQIKVNPQNAFYILHNEANHKIITEPDESSDPSNPSYESAAKCLTEIALIDSSIADDIIRTPFLSHILKNSCFAAEYLIQIAEKHGAANSVAKTLCTPNHLGDYFKIVCSPEKITQALIRVSKQHRDFADDLVKNYLEKMSHDKDYYFFDLSQLIDLTDQYPHLASNLIMRLPKDEKRLMFFQKLIHNLQRAIKEGDLASQLTMAVLEFSGVFSRELSPFHISRDAPQAFNRCTRVLEEIAQKENPTAQEKTLKIHTGQILVAFANASVAGEQLILKTWWISWNTSTDENEYRSESGPFGIRQPKDLLLSEALYQCAKEHCGTYTAIKESSDRSFQLNLAKEYLLVISSGSQEPEPLIKSFHRCLFLLKAATKKATFKAKQRCILKKLNSVPMSDKEKEDALQFREVHLISLDNKDYLGFCNEKGHYETMEINLGLEKTRTWVNKFYATRDNWTSDPQIMSCVYEEIIQAPSLRIEAYSLMAKTFSNYLPFLNQDPFLSFEVFQYFYTQGDPDRACQLIFVTIRNAKECLANPKLEEINEGIQALLTKIYDICFELSLKYIEEKRVDKCGKATINALLSLIPSTHPHYTKADAYLAFGNLDRLEEDLIVSALFYLKEEEEKIAFLKTFYDEAASLGDTGAQLVSSALGNANGTPTLWSNYYSANDNVSEHGNSNISKSSSS